MEHHQKPTPDLPDDFAAFEHALTKVHVRHFHTKDQVAFGIFLRFGSLTSDAQVYHSYGRIRYLTGIPQSSMVRMIHKWRKVGKDITKLDLTIRRSRWVLTPEMEAWITSGEVLQQMVHLSLEQRCEVIRQKYQLKLFSPFALSKLYRRTGISYRRPKYAYNRKEAQMEELKQHQFKVSEQMAELMVQGKHLIYVRSWVRSDTVLTMPSNRGRSVTVIGAISAQLGLVHFKVFHGSNNSETFAQFARGLVK